MEIKLKHHTIVLLIGPTGSGKSTLVQHARVFLEKHGVHSKVVSSDLTRRSLLPDWMGFGGDSVHKHSDIMLEQSEQAFKLLFAQLEAAISFPVNTPVVFVDTKGYDVEFRKRVSELARKNGYVVDAWAFEFKNISDYFEYLPEREKKITEFDARKFRTRILPEMSRKVFDSYTRIHSKSLTKEVTFNLVDAELYDKCNLLYGFAGQKFPFAIIGDSHECVDSLKALITKIQEIDKATRIIHLGDYLDKGRHTREMVDYMFERVFTHEDIVVAGNHEAYLYRRLKGEIDAAQEEIEKTYFTALPHLQQDTLSCRKFKEIYEVSLPYLRLYSPEHRTVYVTHAPCDQMWLGKHHGMALKNQRNLYFQDRRVPEKDAMKFIYDQAVGNFPIHVFGHVAHACEKLMFKNKVFLDTGAVHGGKLSAFVMKAGRFQFLSVDGQPDTMGKVLSTDLTSPPEREFRMKDYNLSDSDRRYYNRIISSGVKFISGTMPPAPSVPGQLESLNSAFDYYQRHGVRYVCLQPKYMGSRGQFYLYRSDLDEKVKNGTEPPKSFATSRGGYVIRHVGGLQAVIQEELERAQGWFDGAWKELILDGEILPWKALGDDLIESQFWPYEEMVRRELRILNGDPEFQRLDIAKSIDTAGRLTAHNVFSETLAHYAKDESLSFAPFDILWCDGRVGEGTPSVIFKDINPDEVIVVDLESEESRKKGHEFFEKKTVTERMEGVVVKPEFDRTKSQLMLKGVVPYMKVRNERYLTLIYGYDYKLRYDRLVQTKNISHKARVAIDEYNLGFGMLSASDELRKELVVKMIGQLNAEQTLDPRL